MGDIKCLPQGFKQGMAAELGNLVYVAFRGTETIGDWLANLDFIQTGQQHGWGRTERGFSGVYAGSALTIIGALPNAGNPTHVFVVGHSLGGHALRRRYPSQPRGKHDVVCVCLATHG